MPAAATPKIFYQSLMPRTGSTHLQNILAQNSQFHVTPASGLLERVFGARLNDTNSAEFKAQHRFQGSACITLCQGCRCR